MSWRKSWTSFQKLRPQNISGNEDGTFSDPIVTVNIHEDKLEVRGQYVVSTLRKLPEVMAVDVQDMQQTIGWNMFNLFITSKYFFN